MLLKFDLSTIGKQISVSSLCRQHNSPIFLRIKTPKIWHRRPDPFGKKTPDKTVFFSVTFQFRPPPTRLQFCLYVVLFCVNILYRPPRGTRLDLSLLPQIVDLLKFKVEMGSVKIQLPKDLTVRVTHVEVLPNRGTLICDTVSNACNEGEKLLAFI